MKAEDFLNKEVIVFKRKWRDDRQVVTDEILFPKALVTGLVSKSRTLVEVKCIEHPRGKGWCTTKKMFVGVRVYEDSPRGKMMTGWYRGENYEWDGVSSDKFEDIQVHISQLKLVKDE